MFYKSAIIASNGKSENYRRKLEILMGNWISLSITWKTWRIFDDFCVIREIEAIAQACEVGSGYLRF
ncbi:unnamed protein product [Caenorhabditis angaria]|uniref:Uncharacterized protein n=1 Tax=Caenorhabditis angaria TaxID=860376 RepID=A0A9P1IMG4_9PELO|nr:unnamed protein product [Caenorhabditis angaria]